MKTYDFVYLLISGVYK